MVTTSQHSLLFNNKEHIYQMEQKSFIMKRAGHDVHTGCCKDTKGDMPRKMEALCPEADYYLDVFHFDNSEQGQIMTLSNPYNAEWSANLTRLFFKLK